MSQFGNLWSCALDLGPPLSFDARYGLPWQVYPGVLKAMDWELKVTQSDPLGLMPVASIHDDALLKDCHQSGQDLWTLVGLKNAITMAQAMGRNQDAERFKVEYQRFWNAFEKQLSIQTAKSGGYIPPALDLTLAATIGTTCTHSIRSRFLTRLTPA